MNTSEVEALFALTLLGDYDSDEAWEAVAELRRDGSREIFERAAGWCSSDDPRKRARAADILCELRRAPTQPDPPTGMIPPGWIFREEAYSLIAAMLEDETDPQVLDSGVHALGHLADVSAVPIILRYQAHAVGEVRFAVAFALGCFPDDPQSVQGLLKLTADADAHVRDWAVFGLGVLGDTDSAEIRDALLRCLDDSDANVRIEAANGLGKRRDQRLTPKLLVMLDEPGIALYLAEAASFLLQMDPDSPELSATDYKAALVRTFRISE